MHNKRCVCILNKPFTPMYTLLQLYQFATSSAFSEIPILMIIFYYHYYLFLNISFLFSVPATDSIRPCNIYIPVYNVYVLYYCTRSFCRDYRLQRVVCRSSSLVIYRHHYIVITANISFCARYDYDNGENRNVRNARASTAGKRRPDTDYPTALATHIILIHNRGRQEILFYRYKCIIHI